jgi:hypothetical protein
MQSDEWETSAPMEYNLQFLFRWWAVLRYSGHVLHNSKINKMMHREEGGGVRKKLKFEKLLSNLRN